MKSADRRMLQNLEELMNRDTPIEPANMGTLMRHVESEPRFNPLLLVGLQPWILRSLTLQELKSFLKDYRRLAAKYFHPDLQHDPLKQQAREWYMKRLNSAVDSLLANDFLLAMTQDNLPLR